MKWGVYRTEAFFFSLLILFLILPGAFGGQIELEPEVTYRIAVGEDGSAVWTIEERFPLDNEEKVRIFQERLSELEAGSSLYLARFENQTLVFVDRARVITGRYMMGRGFQIYFDLVQSLTGKYGIIRYQFEWVGFAVREEREGLVNIIVGDVFQGGFYLYREDALILEYPEGFYVDAVAPRPDDAREPERRLVWYGRKNFASGQPNLYLVEKKVTTITITAIETRGQRIEVNGRIDPAIGGETIELTFTKPDGSSITEKVQTSSSGEFRYTVSQAQEEGKWEVKAAWPGDEEHMSVETPNISFNIDRSISPWTLVLMAIGVTSIVGAALIIRWRMSRRRDVTTIDDEENIIRLLRSSGGMLHQSDIIERTGFSSPKTSLLLSTMERKGTIKRKRRGREKLVILRESTEEMNP